MNRDMLLAWLQFIKWDVVGGLAFKRRGSVEHAIKAFQKFIATWNARQRGQKRVRANLDLGGIIWLLVIDHDVDDDRFYLHIALAACDGLDRDEMLRDWEAKHGPAQLVEANSSAPFWASDVANLRGSDLYLAVCPFLCRFQAVAATDFLGPSMLADVDLSRVDIDVRHMRVRQLDLKDNILNALVGARFATIEGKIEESKSEGNPRWWSEPRELQEWLALRSFMLASLARTDSIEWKKKSAP